jgi:hypothetical protein
MADARRLKRLRRAGLGPPPPPAEARADLAPAAAPGEERGEGRIDGRRLRRSGRTLQFATRVSAAFDARLRSIAERDGLLLVEVLERALDAYERGAGRALDQADARGAGRAPDQADARGAGRALDQADARGAGRAPGRRAAQRQSGIS